MTGNESFAYACYISAAIWAIGCLVGFIQGIRHNDKEQTTIAFMGILASPIAILPIAVCAFISTMMLICMGIPNGILWVVNKLKHKP